MAGKKYNKYKVITTFPDDHSKGHTKAQFAGDRFQLVQGVVTEIVVHQLLSSGASTVTTFPSKPKTIISTTILITTPCEAGCQCLY